jgi:hypothetical protein
MKADRETRHDFCLPACAFVRLKPKELGSYLENWYFLNTMNGVYSKRQGDLWMTGRDWDMKEGTHKAASA